MNRSLGWTNDTKPDLEDLRDVPLGVEQFEDGGDVASWARNIDHYDQTGRERNKKHLVSNILIGSLMIAAIIFAGLAVGLSVNPSSSSSPQAVKVVVSPTAAPTTAKTSPVEPETVPFGDLINQTLKPTLPPTPSPKCTIDVSLEMVPPQNDEYYYDQVHYDYFTVLNDQGEKCGPKLYYDNDYYTTEWCDTSGNASQNTLEDGSYGFDAQVASLKYFPSTGAYFTFYVDRALIGDTPTPFNELLDTEFVMTFKDAASKVTGIGTFSKSTDDANDTDFSYSYEVIVLCNTQCECTYEVD